MKPLAILAALLLCSCASVDSVGGGFSSGLSVNGNVKLKDPDAVDLHLKVPKKTGYLVNIWHDENAPDINVASEDPRTKQQAIPPPPYEPPPPEKSLLDKVLPTSHSTPGGK